MTLRVINADVLDGLKQIPDESVHCVVTSPPYWGLRDYGVEGQIGLEATPQAFVAHMVEVFREVRRVLRPDGTCWVNLGDSYAANRGGTAMPGQTVHEGAPAGTNRAHNAHRDPKAHGLKHKDLIGIPWRVAFALQDDGWWLRQDIIWSKANPMPESVTDRCTKAHEYIFLLTKSARYFYDAEAVKEAALQPVGAAVLTAQHKQSALGRSLTSSALGTNQGDASRNKRSVWTIATAPFSEAHFATFPPELPEICIKAGTSQKGCCSQCGAPWVRETTSGYQSDDRPQMKRAREIFVSAGLTDDHLKAIRAVGITDAGKAQTTTNGFGKNDPDMQRLADEAKGVLKGYYREFLISRPVTSGWSPSCSCNAAVTACTVLDIFAGAGTTLMVADRLQRHAIGIELNPEYAAMAEKRVSCDRGALLELMESA